MVQDDKEDVELMKQNGDMEKGGDPEKGLIPVERQQWGRKSEFMLACIGYAVGMEKFVLTNLKTAGERFYPNFWERHRAHFFYFSIQNTNQVRKKTL